VTGREVCWLSRRERAGGPEKTGPHCARRAQLRTNVFPGPAPPVPCGFIHIFIKLHYFTTAGWWGRGRTRCAFHSSKGLSESPGALSALPALKVTPRSRSSPPATAKRSNEESRLEAALKVKARWGIDPVLPIRWPGLPVPRSACLLRCFVSSQSPVSDSVRFVSSRRPPLMR
jgi:hypothetical protein